MILLTDLIVDHSVKVEWGGYLHLLLHAIFIGNSVPIEFLISFFFLFSFFLFFKEGMWRSETLVLKITVTEKYGKSPLMQLVSQNWTRLIFVHLSKES